MAKAKKTIGGPFLGAAMFCENIVESSDQVLTVVRIVDQITITLPADAPPDIPSDTHRIPVSIWALITFRRGDANIKQKVKLVMNSPSGKKDTTIDQGISLSKAPSGGANLKIRVTIEVKTGGLFWMDVLINGKLITRMPLQINVDRAGKSLADSTARSLILKSAKRKS